MLKRRDVHVSMIGPRCRERFLLTRHDAATPLRALGVEHAGLSTLAPPYHMVRPDPDFHLVLAVLAGRGWCEIAGCPSRLNPGDLLVVPAGTPCAYGILGRRWDIAWFHIFLNDGLGAALAGQQPAVHRTDATRLAAAMNGFIEEVRGGDAEAAILEARLIARRLEREVQADLDRGAMAERRRLVELWNAVDRDLRKCWTVSALADALHVSPATLFRLCARHAGVRPMEQVARLRIEHAGHLLRHTDEPVKAVARMVGYGDASAFSTAYRRITGRSPERDRG